MLAMDASVNVRLLKRVMGSSGSSTRSSTKTAITSTTMPPPTIAAVCHDHQSKLLPARVTQMSRLEKPSEMSAVPQ